jgi:hypothetical protein
MGMRSMRWGMGEPSVADREPSGDWGGNELAGFGEGLSSAKMKSESLKPRNSGSDDRAGLGGT